MTRPLCRTQGKLHDWGRHPSRLGASRLAPQDDGSEVFDRERHRSRSHLPVDAADRARAHAQHAAHRLFDHHQGEPGLHLRDLRRARPHGGAGHSAAAAYRAARRAGERNPPALSRHASRRATPSSSTIPTRPARTTRPTSPSSRRCSSASGSSPSSATSRTSPTSAARCPAPTAATPPTCSRRGC